MRGPAHLFPEAIAPQDLSLEKGAYLLAIRLGRPIEGDLRGSPYVLSAGWYLYAGSARGPGGIKARLSRHFRRDKALHWHVDRLTMAASATSALAFPGGEECTLVARLMDSGTCDVPLPGFGSSDCRQCEAHLLHWIGGS